MASQPITTVAQLSPGDHLWVPIRGYRHHGIFTGFDSSGRPLVCHYSGWVEGRRSGPLVETSLAEFRGGRRLFRTHHPWRAYSGHQTVQRVRSRLGERDYSVHSNNCEHLCYWAIDDQHHSPQVAWVQSALGAFHPALEAASRGWAVFNPRHKPQRSHLLKATVQNLALDWGLRTAARVVAGTPGLVVYASYRFGREAWRFKTKAQRWARQR